MQAHTVARRLAITLGMGLLAASPPAAAEEKVDVATIALIRAEAEQHSQVMDIASWLTDFYGPRLTGSPNTKAAADWAVTTMRTWGLTNVHLERWDPYDSGVMSESWGPLDRGWANERFAFRAISPNPFVINAAPSPWSPDAGGRVIGPAIRFDARSFADLKRYAGKLKGAFFLMDPALPTPAHFEPQASRLTDAELNAMAIGQVQRPRQPAIPPRPSTLQPSEAELIRYDPTAESAARHWLISEGVAALLYRAPGDGGTIAMAGSAVCSRKKGASDELPTIKVSAESYGRLVRIVERNIPITLELDMKNTFYDEPGVSNIIGEIPGNDPKLKDEIVMIGAHFDSWTFGTGATDDGAGSAVMLEAVRILKALHLQPRRTIRIALWTGEEQGALGSNAYVQRHLRDWFRFSRGESGATKAEYDTVSVYFNLDAGTGKIRGIHEQGNAAVGPIFDAWMGPFKDDGMKTVAPSDIGGGDNLAFVRVGLPGFGFIQDPIEYGTRTHHTSADVYERLQPDDMRFNAAVLASFAWQAAQRDDKLPRPASSRRPVRN